MRDVGGVDCVHDLLDVQIVAGSGVAVVLGVLVALIPDREALVHLGELLEVEVLVQLRLSVALRELAASRWLLSCSESLRVHVLCLTHAQSRLVGHGVAEGLGADVDIYHVERASTRARFVDAAVDVSRELAAATGHVLVLNRHIVRLPSVQEQLLVLSGARSLVVSGDNGVGLLLLVVEVLEAHHSRAVQTCACLLCLDLRRGSALGVGPRGGPVIIEPLARGRVHHMSYHILRLHVLLMIQQSLLITSLDV